MNAVLLSILAETKATDSAEDQEILRTLNDLLTGISDSAATSAARVLMAQFPDGPEEVTLADVVAAVVAAELYEIFGEVAAELV